MKWKRGDFLIMLQADNIFILLLGAHPYVNDQLHVEKRHFGGDMNTEEIPPR